MINGALLPHTRWHGRVILEVARSAFPHVTISPPSYRNSILAVFFTFFEAIARYAWKAEARQGVLSIGAADCHKAVDILAVGLCSPYCTKLQLSLCCG